MAAGQHAWPGCCRRASSAACRAQGAAPLPPPPADADVRAVCERRALRFGRRILAGAGEVADAAQLAELAEAARHDGHQPCFPL